MAYLSSDSVSNFETEELKIYDLSSLEKKPANFPPITNMEAIYTAFSLDEVKTKMVEENKVFNRWAEAVDTEIYWTVTAKKLVLPETNDNSWHIVFKANVLPSYMCDVTFSNSGILENDTEIVCGYDNIK
ncbi:MAG: hypothetical protein R3B60_00665 [Candidatus Paceibacterota bacterium]